MSRGTGSLTILQLWLRHRRVLQLQASSPRLRVRFIGLRTCTLELTLIITLVLPDLILAGVNASSAVLPEQRTQPATLELEVEVPLPAAPQARIFHPTNATSLVTKPTPTLPLILLVFFLLAIIA